mmetsp:Transcript_132437/g.369197  ORF Transcript_132437/g.369197 Transcript_132437/m.369197 type:complete len:770 (+) Transcript_132437:100-2409(+)
MKGLVLALLSASGAAHSTTSCHYDCQVGLNNWKAAWAPSKIEYCCKHEKIACGDTTTTSCHFDCKAGLANWKAAWAPAKKEYCCQHEHVACEEATTFAAVATTAATSAPATKLHAATTTSCQFDCQVGLNNWKAAWAPAKIEYCCKHQRVACDEPTVPPSAAANPTTPPPPTTTSCHIDCQAGINNWKAAWAPAKKEWCCKHEKIACEDPTTVAATPAPTTLGSTTTTAPIRLPDHIMTCRLSCFGHAAARPVVLPGSVGVGSGNSLNDVSLDQCRRACAGTADCEAVMFTNKTEGVPFKTQCYGKKNIHTSKCQPGGSRFITEVMGTKPKVFGKCAIFGDPHILPFDRIYGPPTTIITPGVYYLVKSPQLSIHGRFGYTQRFPSASSAVGVALGGPLIKGHTLIVTYVGPEKGYKGFKVLYNGRPILDAYPSSFSDDVLTAKLDAMDPQEYHREGRHTIGGTEGLLPSYFFRLAPDLSIYVLVGPDNCNVVIEAPKLRDAQDGWCGNFNCDQADDGLGAMRSRGVAGPIPAGESLFKDGPTAPAWVMKRVAPPSLEDCSPTVKAAAEAKCAGLGRDERESCIFDACAADAAVAAAQDAAAEVSHYNCHKGSPMAWEHKQWRWCCEHEGVGCDVGGPCDAECMYAGRNATCKARIHWASTHLLANQQDACEQAMGLVRKQCPDACATCSLELAECLGQGSHLGIFKKFEQARQTLPETVARAGFPAQVAILGSLLAAGLAVARLRSGSIRWQLGQPHSWDVAEDLPMLE